MAGSTQRSVLFLYLCLSPNKAITNGTQYVLFIVEVSVCAYGKDGQKKSRGNAICKVDFRLEWSGLEMKADEIKSEREREKE